MINIKILHGRVVYDTSPTSSLVHRIDLELAGTKIFMFLTRFGQIRGFSMKIERSGEKKYRCHQKKNQNFLKVTHVTDTASKVQPQTPSELGEIQNLAKTFLTIKTVFREQFEFTL